MSNIVMPGGEPAKKGFVIGRRLRLLEDLIMLSGQLLVLRAPEGAGGGFAMLKNGYVGVICGALPLPTYPKRADAITCQSFVPGNITIIQAGALEASDPWCHPPGFPEKAVSLLRGADEE